MSTRKMTLKLKYGLKDCLLDPLELITDKFGEPKKVIDLYGQIHLYYDQCIIFYRTSSTYNGNVYFFNKHMGSVTKTTYNINELISWIEQS